VNFSVFIFIYKRKIECDTLHFLSLFINEKVENENNTDVHISFSAFIENKSNSMYAELPNLVSSEPVCGGCNQSVQRRSM